MSGGRQATRYSSRDTGRYSSHGCMCCRIQGGGSWLTSKKSGLWLQHRMMPGTGVTVASRHCTSELQGRWLPDTVITVSSR